MRAVLFIGPSTPAEAELPPGLELRPPAITGDLYAACEDGFDLIALVDGRFGDCRSVLHDEILHALAQGVPVWGAASLGALRAVECLPFGMRGIGRIFDLYRDGAIEDDHEVALVHGPPELGARPLSEPLINVRLTLQDRVAAGLLRAEDAASILAVASDLYYPALSWARLREELGGRLAETVADIIAAGPRDYKREDAARLLAELGQAMSAGVPPVPAFEFHETTFWAENRRTLCHAGSRLSALQRDVLDELRLMPERYAMFAERAWQRCAHDAAPVAGPPGTATWRTDGAAGGSAAHPTDIGRDRLAREILDDLLAADAFDDLADRARAKRAIAEDSEACPAASVVDRALPDLFAWFCRTRRIVCEIGDMDEIAESLGLSNRRDMYRLLERERRYLERSAALETAS
ncbi:MAG: TfuA-like protein [Pseudomonadota bacterium]